MWKIFPGFTTLGILEEIQKLMKSVQGEPEQFNGRIIFMSMFMPLYGEKTETQRNEVRILSKFRSTFAGFLAVVGHSWDLDQNDKPDANWDRTADMMILQLTTKSGHTIFRVSSAFERGDLGSKGHGKKSTPIER